MKSNIDTIKESIQTMNPQITDELLDLLYEYFSARIKEEYSYDKMAEYLKNESFANIIQSIILNR